MCISYQTAYFLSKCTSNNDSSLEKVNFSQTLTLGRQNFSLSKSEVEKLLKKQFESDFTQQKIIQFYKKLENATAARFPTATYSEPFFELLAKNGGRLLILLITPIMKKQRYFMILPCL